ncbi:hypothetical protein BJ085DRAFT_39592 [Dimargaris cristalligena]|uniref:Uncharacterized protein n=1 Tax=Dimargaris cristalligena TaxID=215637 RepID=A0A4Q0A1N0_9FUNG|nr:hypothetical protein BJ085DRAFT_39592 [Dimargaris cristalligena]|eukprot:RKP39060.1 hypothetical protein BJ085DRAFT_39592 [Dimargaris cristalligena]
MPEYINPPRNLTISSLADHPHHRRRPPFITMRPCPTFLIAFLTIATPFTTAAVLPNAESDLAMRPSHLVQAQLNASVRAPFDPKQQHKLFMCMQGHEHATLAEKEACNKSASKN